MQAEEKPAGLRRLPGCAWAGTGRTSTRGTSGARLEAGWRGRGARGRARFLRKRF